MNIEKMVGTRVFLELFVKVQPGWRESRKFVEELDWRRQLEQIAGPARPESDPADSMSVQGPKLKARP
jgi:GTP-binding protein Era